MKQLDPIWRNFCACLYWTFILTCVKKSDIGLEMIKYNRHFTRGLTYIYGGSPCNRDSVVCELQPEAKERVDDLYITTEPVLPVMYELKRKNQVMI
jgi:hypothetical protein